VLLDKFSWGWAAVAPARRRDREHADRWIVSDNRTSRGSRRWQCGHQGGSNGGQASTDLRPDDLPFGIISSFIVTTGGRLVSAGRREPRCPIRFGTGLSVSAHLTR
jgi:hypothetical protein